MSTQTTTQTTINTSPNLTPWQRRPTVGARKFGARNFGLLHLAAHNRWLIKAADGFSYAIDTALAREAGQLVIRASQAGWPVSQIVAREGGHSSILEATPLGLSWERLDLRVKAAKLNIKCAAERNGLGHLQKSICGALARR